MLDTLSDTQILWLLLTLAIGLATWLYFFLRKERRLFRNIRRPVAVIVSKDNPLKHEVDMLRRVGFFNIADPSDDPRAVDSLNGKRLLIIGYAPKSDTFRVALDAAKRREIPVVIYANPREITDADMKLLRGYTHHTMCNTPLRLISDVFAIMATYPESR